MSTLGKIVTVLVVVAAVAVGAMSAVYVSVSTDYRATLQEVKGAVGEAREQNTALRASLTEAKGQLENLQLQKQKDVADYQTKLAEINADLTRVRGEVATRDATLQEVNTKIGNLKDGVDALNKDIAEVREAKNEAEKQAMQATDRNAELAKALYDATRQRNDLESQLMAAQQRMVELEKQLNSIPPEARPARVNPLPAVDLRGAVTRVDPANGMAQIDLGASDGVVTDMTFLVQRNGRYLGDLVVTKLDENTAIGRLQTVQGQIQEGDHVRYNVR